MAAFHQQGKAAMFERFSRSWELAKASASVIQADKELLLFPVMSGLVTLVLMATFILPIYVLGLFAKGNEVMGAVLAFLFYFTSYSVTFFFNSALVAAALIRLDGGDPTVADGLNAAKARIVPILGYAAIAATVGMILNGMRNRDNNLIVRMIGAGLGVAWTLSTFLVVPVLVNENLGPIDAIKESISLLKKTWGENAIGNVGIGMVFGAIFFCALLVGAVLVFAALTVSPTLALAVGIFVALALVFLAIVQTALSSVYSAALYRFATVGEAPAGFENTAIATAFAPRR
jgi:hypothetical protein